MPLPVLLPDLPRSQKSLRATVSTRTRKGRAPSAAPGKRFLANARLPPPSSMVTRFVSHCSQLGKPPPQQVGNSIVTLKKAVCEDPNTLQHCTPVETTARDSKRRTQHAIRWCFVECARTNRDLFRRLQRHVCPQGTLSLEALRKHFTPERIRGILGHKMVVFGGDIQYEQLPAFHRLQPDATHVVLNASQTNFLEQNAPSHDPWQDLRGFYKDPTFGPGVVKYQPGGVEFIAWTLRPFLQQNVCKYGALQAFFDEQQHERNETDRSRCSVSAAADQLHIPYHMGYYMSNLNHTEQQQLATDFLQSRTRVCGFRWSQPAASLRHDTFVYQTGAINSKHEGTNRSRQSVLYHHLHRRASPAEELEFGVICAQLFNAMYTESKHAPVAFHTTRIGEGVFGNAQNVSLYALVAAYACLPKRNQANIRAVSVGGFSTNEQLSLSRFFGLVGV